MGLEAATYISQLNAANPVGAADPKAQGDDHLRLIKSTLQASFPGITGAMTRTQTQLNLIGTDGTAALPSYTFTLDLDTGIYRIANNVLGFTAGGVNNFFYDGVSIGIPDGTLAIPGVRFNSDGDTGFYRRGANDFAASAGNTLVCAFTSASLNMGLPISSARIIGSVGSAALPEYSFAADPDTGLYSVTGNQLGIAAGGALIVDFYTGGAVFTNTVGNQLQVPDGTALLPALAFSSDGNTGLYRIASDRLGFATGGVLAAEMDSLGKFFPSGGIFAIDGNAATPSNTFVNDIDTGLYRDTANQIGIALGGVTAGQIAQGSFVMTLTGFAAAVPTPTMTWQRVGNRVTARVPQFTGTSNAVGFTCTNLPAIIQPSVGIATPYFVAADNGANVLNGNAQINGATMTFQNGVSGVWTAAGNKGLGAIGAAPSVLIEWMV